MKKKPLTGLRISKNDNNGATTIRMIPAAILALGVIYLHAEGYLWKHVPASV